MSNAATETEKPEKIWTTTPKKLRQTIYWLALDWIGLHRDLPTPPKGETTRTSNTREYGHPAEWASDKAREIVDKLTSWHDMLAEHRQAEQATKAAPDEPWPIPAGAITGPTAHKTDRMRTAEDRLHACHNQATAVEALREYFAAKTEARNPQPATKASR